MASLDPKRAFTLIELLMVMAIMAVMLTITVAAFNSMGSGTGLRGAQLQIRSQLTLARQNAISRRVKTRMHMGNTGDSRGMVERGYIYMAEVDRNVSSNEYVVGNTNFLPKGYVFGPTLVAPDLDVPDNEDIIEFKYDGSADAGYPDTWDSDLTQRSQAKDIVIQENRPGGLVATSVVYAMTGRIKHWSHK